MIEYRQGDLLACEAEALVNTVNCVGVMGRGIALQFKRQFPDNEKYYKAACERNGVALGEMLVYETNSMFNPKYIINFPTKQHWRSGSKLADIEMGLIDLVDIVKTNDIKTIAVPPLGCGLGGLDWHAVKPLMESAFSKVSNVNFIVFEPFGAPPAEEMVKNLSIPSMTTGRAALIILMKRYLDGLLDPIITLLEVHKLMYFLQERGEPLKLIYEKAYYGPYAKNLSYVLNTIEGHMLSGYADGGDNPDKELFIMPGAEKEASTFLKENISTNQRIDSVADLITGFENPTGMELLASVHWVSKEEEITNEEAARRIYEWGPQKEKFSLREIDLAFETLTSKGWIKQSGAW